jgi:transposase
MKDDSQINWKERYFELLKKVELLEARIAALEIENQHLKLENKFLREKLNTNSNNSSKPPSQDPFRNTRNKKPSGRKQGGQFGHPGHKRHLYPIEQVTKVIDLKPDTCPHCGSINFDEKPQSIECRQVVELPAIQPEVTQYNIFTCQCENCKKRVRPIIPSEAEKGFGPRLMGFVTMLSGEARVTKRKICSIATHLGMKISLGSICNIHHIAGTILENPFEVIRNTVLAHKTVNADESSWRFKAKRCWIWIGATPGATFFKIDSSRSQETFNKIFQGFRNTLSSDRYGAYNSHEGKKQTCLAHIARDFEKMSEREGVDGALGRILCDELNSIFELWRQFKTQTRLRQALQEKAQVRLENIRNVLVVASSAAGIASKTSALCSDLLQRFPSLWTFLYEDDVEPTNNLAEQGLRPAVIWRKISGGSQSEWGITYAERLLTIVYTLRQRSKNLFEFLVESFRAHIQRARPPPVFGT